ncbi:MAG: DUF4139 domain-containing protein [Gemmatales bacterium]
MRRIWIAVAVAVCLMSMSMATEAGPEKEVKTKVVSVALFKNGLAVVKRQVALDGTGSYRITDVPEPIHGTYWVESNGLTESRVEMRESTLPTPAPLGTNLPVELHGLKVTIRSRDGKTVTTGVVQAPPKKEKEESIDPPPEYSGYRPPPEPTSRFLILKTEKGIAYVDQSDIGGLEVEGEPKADPRTQKKPVLILVSGDGAKAGNAQISYLAHGLSWAPSYKVDLTTGKSLTIEQHAVIRNELADLSDTEVSLISGYPSVQFSQVISPLAASQTWARFFQQLNSRGGQYEQQIMMQNAAYQMRAPGGGGAAAPEVAPNLGDTIDLNYHSIGKRTLKKGSALALVTGQASTDYERIVDWTIPDNRDEWGNHQGRNNRRVDPNTGEPLQDDVWDALKFKNPLPFPMTTAPATVTTAGTFSGQRQVLWTNKIEEATLRVNKALSIRAKHVEYENQTGANGVAERDIIYIGGQRFRRATVNGELRLCNHRPADVKMIAKRQFSGDYIKGDGDPRIDLREEGVWTVNKRNELTWTINLKPNEERVIKFQYTVLVHF